MYVNLKIWKKYYFDELKLWEDIEVGYVTNFDR